MVSCFGVLQPFVQVLHVENSELFRKLLCPNVTTLKQVKSKTAGLTTGTETVYNTPSHLKCEIWNHLSSVRTKEDVNPSVRFV